MTLASAAFGFGQPLRPNLMFMVGFFALGPVLWWIRTLHIQIRRSRDHFLHVGFLSPPVSDRPNPGVHHTYRPAYFTVRYAI